MKRVRSPENNGNPPATESSRPERRRSIPGEAPRAFAAPEPFFVRPQTFFGLPRRDVTDSVPAVDVLLTGVPYDGGSLESGGARLAPRAIREASLGLGGPSEALGIQVWEE